MSNRISHGIAGTLGGGIISLISNIEGNSDHRLNIQKVVTNTAIGGLVGLLGGVLPDILEAPTNSFHRKFFHSKVIGILILMGISYSVTSQNKNIFNSLIDSLGSGYLTHLMLDSTTPRGLPFLYS